MLKNTRLLGSLAFFLYLCIKNSMNTINEFIYCLVTAVSILMCCLAWLIGTFIVDPLLALSEWLVDFARYIQDEATKMVNTPL